MRRDRWIALLLLLVATPTAAGELIADLIPRARQAAVRWQPDAVLVEVQAKPGADGTVGPPPEGASLHFFSPSTGRGLTVIAGPGMLHAVPTSAGLSRAALPETVIDLGRAVVEAHKAGLPQPVASAGLRVPDDGGRATWTLTAVAPARMPRPAIEIDAVSGAVVPGSSSPGAHAVSGSEGTPDPERQARPRSVPDLRRRAVRPAPDPDFRSVRAAADEVAADQGAFQLHQVEVELRGQTLEVVRADFRYAGRARGPGWEELVVSVVTGHPAEGRPPVGTIGGSRRPGVGETPAPAPAAVLAPEDAVRLFPGQAWSTPGTIRLQLIQVGASEPARRPPLAPPPGRSPLGTLVVDTAARGSWIWWTIARRADGSGRQDYLHVDAVTGAPAARCFVQARLGVAPCPDLAVEPAASRRPGSR